MKLNLPEQFEELLHGYQEAEIRKRILGPIGYVLPSDPIWPDLDDHLTHVNNVLELSERDLTFTVHELFPDRFAVWMQDVTDLEQRDLEREIIVMGARDIQTVRDSGFNGLALATLLREF